MKIPFTSQSNSSGPSIRRVFEPIERDMERIDNWFINNDY